MPFCTSQRLQNSRRRYLEKINVKERIKTGFIIAIQNALKIKLSINDKPNSFRNWFWQSSIASNIISSDDFLSEMAFLLNCHSFAVPFIYLTNNNNIIRISHWVEWSLAHLIVNKSQLLNIPDIHPLGTCVVTTRNINNNPPQIVSRL